MTEPLAIDRRAARRIQLDDTSWVDTVDGFVVEPLTAFQELRETTPWATTEVLRYDRYVEEKRLGAGLRSDSITVLRQTTLHLSSRYRAQLEGVAALLYRDGDDFQGLHSDREMRWLDNTLVAIVVLGERRPFVLRRRSGASTAIERVPAGADVADVVLRPGEGDLLVMGGRAQRDWLHGVPRADTKLSRISLTWRWTSKTGSPDTNPTYYDGRRFADAPRSDTTRRPGSRRRPA